MRVSKIDHRLLKEVDETVLHGKGMQIVSYGGNGGNLRIRNMKHRNSAAWYARMCEIEIDGKRSIVNADDLITALNNM